MNNNNNNITTFPPILLLLLLLLLISISSTTTTTAALPLPPSHRHYHHHHHHRHDEGLQQQLWHASTTRSTTSDDNSDRRAKTIRMQELLDTLGKNCTRSSECLHNRLVCHHQDTNNNVSGDDDDADDDDASSGQCVECVHSDQCFPRPAYACMDTTVQMMDGTERTLRTCREKSLLPLSLNDVLASAACWLGSVVASSAGIGGGGLFNPLLMLAQFPTEMAVPMSTAIIFGASTTSTLLFVFTEHPKAKGRPIIDYSLILLTQPIILCGTTIGVILNILFPGWLIVLLLFLLLMFSSHKSFNKGLSIRREHHASLQAQRIRELHEFSEYTDDDDDDDDDGSVEMIEVRLHDGDDGPVDHYFGHGESHMGDLDLHNGNASASGGGDYNNEKKNNDGSNNGSDGADHGAAAKGGDMIGLPPSEEEGAAAGDVNDDMMANDALERALQEVQTPGEAIVSMPADEGKRSQAKSRLQRFYGKLNLTLLPVHLMLLVVMEWIVVFVFNVIKGSRALPSIINVDQCGPWYWVIVLGSLVVMYVASLLFGVYLRIDYGKKIRTAYQFVKGDVRYHSKNAFGLPLLFFFVGFAGALVGIGGGMLSNPLMLDIGVLPQVTVATSSVMLLLTASAAMVQYVVAGRLQFDYMMWCIGVGITSALLGQLGIGRLVKKLGKPYILVFIVTGVIFVSALGMSAVGVYNTIMDIFNERYSSLFFSNLC